MCEPNLLMLDVRHSAGSLNWCYMMVQEIEKDITKCDVVLRNLTSWIVTMWQSVMI